MTDVAQRYGLVLYELAREEGVSQLVMEQSQVLLEAFCAEPDFLRLLGSHNLSKQDRCALVNDCFGDKIHPYLLNFLKTLIREGIVGKFPDCCRHIRSCYYADNDTLLVQVYTAQALTPDQVRLLTQKMERITGKRLILENKIDPDCLGGVRLCYDGKQIDGTVKNYLGTVRNLLKITVL